MAKPHRLKEIEQEFEEPLTTLIPRLLNELGTMQAVANHLGTTLQTIYGWCRDNNVVRQVRWSIAPDVEKVS
jgi:hypothetical protein